VIPPFYVVFQGLRERLKPSSGARTALACADRLGHRSLRSWTRAAVKFSLAGPHGSERGVVNCTRDERVRS
jgi:hypothetical protein